jgi:bifunctional UDP-N-acetylglucosamine pyrophosphorylase/glucosamine-1-phosphate N-acetyltransferase
MVLHVIDALAELDVDRVVVVVGHGAEQVVKTVTELAPAGLEVTFAEQSTQRGTGDAAAVGLGGLDMAVDDDEDLVILPGDTPLLRPATLADLVRTHRAREAGVTLLTAEAADPAGYGRVVRSKDGRVAGIVEHADATEEQRLITEVNTSIYCFRRSVLAPSLRRLSPKNAQGELYLTDVVAVLHDAGFTTHSLTVADPMEAAGVNDRAQLSIAEAELRDRINERWMRRGVTMWDPERTYVDATVDLAEDVTLLPGSILRGSCRVGPGARIGPNALLEDTVVAERSVVETVRALRASIGPDALVESFSTLRAGAVVAAGERLEPGTTREG